MRYVDFSGTMDTCSALRTWVVTPTSDGMHRVDAQVGAGIVADSEPANEYQETLAKARGRRTTREKPASPRRRTTPRVVLRPDLVSGLPM